MMPQKQRVSTDSFSQKNVINSYCIDLQCLCKFYVVNNLIYRHLTKQMTKQITKQITVEGKVGLEKYYVDWIFLQVASLCYLNRFREAGVSSLAFLRNLEGEWQNFKAPQQSHKKQQNATKCHKIKKPCSDSCTVIWGLPFHYLSCLQI